MSTPLQFEQLISQVDELVEQGQNELAKNYSQALKETRNIIQDKFDSYAVGGELTLEEMQKYSRRKNLNKEVQEAMNDLWVENGREIRKDVREVYKTSFNETKRVVEEAAQRTVRGKYKREMAQKALQNPISGLTLNERLSRRRRDVIERIQETIGQGLYDNETYTQMSRRLKEELENDLVKANRIIRTEAHRVQEQAKDESLDYAQNQGIEIKKYWISARDTRVREAGEGDHEGMDSRYTEEDAIPKDEDFVNPETGGQGPTPGQLGVAQDDINCRCVTGYIVVTDD